MEIYLKEKVNREEVWVQYPVRGHYELASGYFEWELDTHNGYDGYCLDIVRLDEKGSRYSDKDGLEASNSFGHTIYAAQDGVVEIAISHNIDHPIGSRDYFAPNFIRIKHTQNGAIFYTVYYHIRQNSSLVESGDEVKKGQPIAQIGNSGYTFGPHLHCGVYDTSYVSLPVNFEGTSANINYKHGMRFL